MGQDSNEQSGRRQGLLITSLFLVTIGLLTSGCVSTKAHKTAMDAAFKAGQAERCVEDLRAFQEVTTDAQEKALDLRNRLRELCEKDKRYALIDDLCVRLVEK